MGRRHRKLDTLSERDDDLISTRALVVILLICAASILSLIWTLPYLMEKYL